MPTEFWNSLHLVKRLYDKSLEPVCRRYDVTRMELDLLLFLANNPGFDTAKDVIERRKLTKSHVSASMQALEQRGYLERRFAEGNRKTVHLSLLSAAGELVDAGRTAQKSFYTALFQNFTPRQVRELENAFTKIAENVRGALLEES